MGLCASSCAPDEGSMLSDTVLFSFSYHLAWKDLTSGTFILATK